MYVKDHMTKEPVTITRDTKISKAVDIMSKGHFHRLPIVDDSGKLIGHGKERRKRNFSVHLRAQLSAQQDQG